LALLPKSRVLLDDGTMLDATRPFIVMVSDVASPSVVLPVTVNCGNVVAVATSSHVEPLSYQKRTSPTSVVIHLRPAVPAAGREARSEDWMWIPESAS